jgi:hypothetical protein
MNDLERDIRSNAFPCGLKSVLLNDVLMRNLFETALEHHLGVVETLTWMVAEGSKDRARLMDEAKKEAARCMCRGSGVVLCKEHGM